MYVFMWFVEGKFDCYAQHWIAHRKIFCGFSALRLAPDISDVLASHLANDSGRSALPASQPRSVLSSNVPRSALPDPVGRH